MSDNNEQKKWKYDKISESGGDDLETGKPYSIV